MEKSFFSRRGISVATLVAMLASQFAPIGLNMTYAAANDITLTNTNPAGFDGVNVPNFSTTITIATAADILDGSTFDITLPAYLPDIAAGDLDDGFLGFTVTGLGAGASVARLSARVAQVTIATALTAATGDAPFADNDTIVITFTTTADTAGTAAGTVGNTAPTFAIAGTVAGNAVQSAITMVVGSDITLLTAAKSTAAGLITANAPESTTPGQHTVGALATLIAAQAAANATVASPQLTVDGQVTTLNAAIATYNLALVPNSDITLLTAAKSTAAGLITANAPESTTPGQHTVGALATLIAAQAAANATVASPQLTVDGQVTTLNAAIATYNLALVPNSDITLLTAAKSTAAGLITANAPESTTPGQHTVGALATLIAAQAAANATVASPQLTVDGQVTTLNAAIATYNLALVPNSDITLLTAAKSTAAGLITANAPESTTPGQHTVGALATLIAAQAAANATVASPQLTVDGQVTTLNAAIATYNLALVPNSDITLLTAAKSTAAGLITANAPESTTPGQHTVGALATLIAAQAAANATVASPQLTVDGQVTTLNAAIATYNLALVPNSDITLLTAAKSTAAGLITANAPESTTPGQHTVGALATLIAAQAAANATVASPQLTVDGQVTTLNAAIATYNLALVPNSDITLLTAAKSTAAGLITANAPESTTPGQHTVGALATLIAAQAAANATVASPQLTVDGQVTTLNAAIATYNLALVPNSDITLLTAAKSTAAGLITANAPESTTPGQHTVGALATLIAAQAAANATVASPQLTVDGQVTTLNAAIATYNTAIVGIDIIGPVVTLSGAATLTLAYGAVYTELGARWTDVVDGSGAATISGSVNTSIAGTYTLTYQKTDLAGNPSNIVTRTVTVSAQVYSGGSSSSSTPYVPPTVVPPPATNKPAVTQSTIPPSSNPNITQDLFAKSNTDFKKSKIITTPSTLKAGTQINIMRVLPNGKSIKVGTTRVLRNGVIRYTVKTAGKYSFVQK